MSIRSFLTDKLAPAPETIVSKIEKRIVSQEQAVATARADADSALLAAEADETAASRAKADKALAVLATAEARLRDLRSALAEAQRRAQAAASAEAAAERQRAAKEAAALRAQRVARAAKTGAAVDKALVEFATTVAEAMDAQRDLRGYIDSSDFSAQFLTASLNLFAILNFRLKDVAGAGGIGLSYTEDRATWTQYLPSSVLAAEPEQDVAA